MIKKETLLSTADQLPAEFTIDELIDRLILIQKIEQAQEESRAGKGVPQEQVKELVRRWSK